MDRIAHGSCLKCSSLGWATNQVTYRGRSTPSGICRILGHNGRVLTRVGPDLCDVASIGELATTCGNAIWMYPWITIIRHKKPPVVHKVRVEHKPHHADLIRHDGPTWNVEKGSRKIDRERLPGGSLRDIGEPHKASLSGQKHAARSIRVGHHIQVIMSTIANRLADI